MDRCFIVHTTIRMHASTRGSKVDVIQVGGSADCSDTDQSASHAPDGHAMEQISLDHKDVLAHRILSSRRKGQSTIVPKAESSMSVVHGVRTRGKPKLAKNACNQCQKRKTKCSEERPVCHFCSDRGLECSWNTINGLTRTADLKRKVYEADERTDDLSTFLNMMRHATDQVSSMLLAKLRCGMSLKDLIHEIHSPSSIMNTSGLNLLEKAANARQSLIPPCCQPYTV